MPRKILVICVLMGIFGGTLCAHGYLDLSSPQRNGTQRLEQPEIESTILPVEKIYVLDEIKERNEPAGESTEISPVPREKPGMKSDEPVHRPVPEEIIPEKKGQSKGRGIAPDPVPLPHGNKELTNYNILFFGIEDEKLQMLTVYSINKDNNWKSGTVFIPTDTLVPGTRNQYMADYFYRNGAEKVKQLIQDAMEITINYYVVVDRNLLLEVEPYIDPIYVGGEKVNLSRLFTKEITPEDEIILASLLRSLTKPTVYFGVLPKLVLTGKKYIKTDFQLNWTNLWVHYQIAKNIDTTSVTKKIISGKYLNIGNQKYWIPTRHAWWNMVYEVTK